MENLIETLRKENSELEKMVIQLTKENIELRQQNSGNSELFADWMLKWLNKKKMTVKANTYDIYEVQVKVHIEPYFREKNLTLGEITPSVLEQYYCEKYLSGLSGATINKHHSNIHSALKDAVKNRMIMYNPADLADKPQLLKFVGNALSKEQLQKVFAFAKKSKIFTPVYISGIMGLRRSEVLGLRWSDIDFENKTMCIQHTVVKYVENHKTKLMFSDIPKTQTSRRTLPIPETLFLYLKEIRKKQLKYYAKNRKNYCNDYLKYICVDYLGNLINPDYISRTFHNVVKNLGYECRFHDLRHTCASLLIQQGVPMKSVSQWLGHSSMNVTSEVYVHLLYQDKINIADTIQKTMEDICF